LLPCCGQLDLHSLPARRSSDLRQVVVGGVAGGQVDRLALREGLPEAAFRRGQVLDVHRRLRGSGGVVPRDGQWCRTLRNRKEKRSEEHTSELQSRENLVCRLLL